MTNFYRPVVLIVEDEELIRMLAVDVFLSEGFDVVEAGHAEQAMSAHDANGPIDVLFTDVNMPGDMNGIDLAERLTRLSPGMKIIIASARPILRSIAHLPATFVAKPYDLTGVCTTAHRLVAA